MAREFIGDRREAPDALEADHFEARPHAQLGHLLDHLVQRELPRLPLVGETVYGGAEQDTAVTRRVHRLALTRLPGWLCTARCGPGTCPALLGCRARETRP